MEVNMADTYFAFSYDDSHIDEIVASASVDSLKICDACGKQFLPSGRNAWRMRYCQRKHFMKCKVCETIFDCSFEKGIPNTCSRKCGNIYKGMQTRATMRSKYGVDNPSQVPEFKEKAKYSNALHRDETMAKIRSTMIERYGAAIPRQVPELREKIAKKLSEMLTEDSTNRHLQNQLQRIYLAKISTVHGFCTDVLRENAFRLEIPGDFRVAEENECAELQTKVLDQILEEAYSTIGEDPYLRCVVDTQGFGRDDRQIPDIMMKVHSSARCHLIASNLITEGRMCRHIFAIDRGGQS